MPNEYPDPRGKGRLADIGYAEELEAESKAKHARWKRGQNKKAERPADTGVKAKHRECQNYAPSPTRLGPVRKQP